MDSSPNQPGSIQKVKNFNIHLTSMDEEKTELRHITEGAEPRVMGEFDPTKTLNTQADVKIDVRHVNFFYGPKQALFDVSLPIRERQITALIGPSGCGKSTFLRTLNRMNDLIPGTRTQGAATFGGLNIYGKSIDVVALRQRIGMVFQRPNPFPKSIFENVAY